MNPERYDAFKLGFVSALVEQGYIEKTANIVPITTLPITPELLISPFRASLQLARAGATGAGAGAAYLTSPTENDSDLSKIEAETGALNQQAEKLDARRRQRIVSAILARRKASA